MHYFMCRLSGKWWLKPLLNEIYRYWKTDFNNKLAGKSALNFQSAFIFSENPF